MQDKPYQNHPGYLPDTGINKYSVRINFGGQLVNP